MFTWLTRDWEGPAPVYLSLPRNWETLWMEQTLCVSQVDTSSPSEGIALAWSHRATLEYKLCRTFLPTKGKGALPGVAQCVGHYPANWKVTSLIQVRQGTRAPIGSIQEATDPLMFLLHIDVSLLLFLPPLPLSKNKSFFKKGKGSYHVLVTV